MRNRYKRKAWFLDEDILIEGFTDKRGFHPNKGTQCGFGTQMFNKRMVNKRIFYNLFAATKVCGDISIVK